MSKFKILQEAANYQELFKKLVKGFKHLMKRDPNKEEILKIKQEAYGRAGKGQVIKGDFSPNEKWWEINTKNPEKKAKNITIDELIEGKPYMDERGRNWQFEKPKKGKTVEDFRDKGDWDPYGMAYGGIAPLIGEPSYAANFYDDRIPYEGGGKAGFPPIAAPPQAPNLPMQGPTIPATGDTSSGITGSEMILQQQKQNQMQMQQMNPMMKQGIGAMAQGGRIGYKHGTRKGYIDYVLAMNALGLTPMSGEMYSSLSPIMSDQEMVNMGSPDKKAEGGRIGFEKGGKGMDRRTFMKMLGGLGALPFVGKFFKGAKTAAPAVEAGIETIKRGADGIPEYVYDLIQVVKTKGVKKISEGIFKRNPPSKKYNYKGVEVVEDGLGNTSVSKQQMKTGSWTDEASDSTYVDDYVDREVGFEIRKADPEVKGSPKEYNESTAIMQGDPDGSMDVSEILESIDDTDHLDLKKIADEIIDFKK